MDRVQQETATALERRAVSLLEQQRSADHREVQQALDQLRADRANGEPLDDAVERLAAALAPPSPA